MKKRVVSLMLAAAMAAATLSGCSGNANGEENSNQGSEDSTGTEQRESVVTEPTELTFIFADGDEGTKEVMTSVVEKFNEAYPDITVTIEPGNGSAYDEFLKTKESVGEFPDIMEMRNTATYVRAGKLAPLPDEITSLFATTTEVEGDVYTAPLGGEGTNGIIYNKAYFDENGLEEPESYEEFIELCETIEELGDMTPLVVGGQDIWHLGFLFDKVYSDQVMSQDEDFIAHCYEGTKDFTDDSFKAALEELQEIMQFAQEGWSSTPDAQITTFLVNDMSAMMYSGNHMFSQIESADPSFEIGWFAIPSPDGKIRLTGGAGAGGLAISAEAAEDENKKAAAEEFIKFFFEPENYKQYCERLSSIPTTVDKPELEVSEVFQEVIDANESADVLTPMWNNKIGDNELPPDFRNFVYKTAVEVLQGTRDIDSACDEINKTWQNSIKSFNPVTGVGIDD